MSAPQGLDVRGPTEFPESPLSQALKQPLMLGLFLPIQAGGWSASTLPRTTDWTFEYNADLVQQIEGLGFDLAFGLSQWLPKGGYGGVLNGQALDSFIALAAMAAITKRIMLISTVHVLYGPWHPLHFAKYSDIVFMTSPTGSEIESALASLPDHIARIKARAHQQGRKIRTLINPMVVCRETERETLGYHQAIVDHMDLTTSPRGFGRFDSDAHACRGRTIHDRPDHHALGGNIQIIGTPQQVADYIVRLKLAAIDGIQLSFFDFKPDLTFFGERVLPLLYQAGLRK